MSGEFKTETITKFKAMYAEKKDFLEWLLEWGNDFERASASVVIEVAMGARKPSDFTVDD